MEVKTGYKQTELGVLPEDWEIAPLGELLRRNPSYGINAPAIPFDFRFPTYLRITDITEDGRFAEATKASVDHRSSAAYLLERGDLVFARTGASVGKSYLYNPDDGHLVFAGFLIRLSPDPERLVPAFLKFFVQSRPYWNWVKINSMRSGQPGINGREYASLPIPIPPTKAEQEAIAEVLSDADALIESLEQLVAKKRQAKQGAVQELLTGKTRLPGFSGEWEEKRLGELGSTFGGLTGKAKRDFGRGTAQYITFMNIMTNVVIDCGIFESVDIKPAESQNRVAKGDLCFNGSSETPDEVGMCAVLAQEVQDVYLNSFCFGFRLRGGGTADGLYLAYFFRSREGRELLKSLAQGATRYNLSKTALMKIVFPLPQLREQSAIAAVLSDMDAEIAALEARLAKARQVKRGMMQELLTGRIRLV
jgi:type I restriction enzyme, S subunit